MTIQRTLSIIKLDAVNKNKINAITSRFEETGLQAAKICKISTSIKISKTCLLTFYI